MLKKEFILEGLNCASCSSKIEDSINKMEYVDNAVINFPVKKLTVLLKNDTNDNVFTDVKKIVAIFEPDVKLVEYNGKTPLKPSSTHECDDDACKIGVDEEHITEETFFTKNKRYIKFGLAAILFVVGLILNSSAFNVPTPIIFSIFLVAYLLIGLEVLVKAINNIRNGQVFDENFLMAIATIGAFLIGDFAEGVAVMLFYQVGEFFQDKAVDNSRRSIAGLMDIKAEYANLVINDSGTTEMVSPEELSVGDKIIVKAGEKIPVDGIIIEGNSNLDMKALTGESIPKSVSKGTDVFSGSINQNGLLTIEVRKIFEDSTVAKILDLVENASSKKSKTENFITKFARYYTPAVVFLAIALAIIPPLFAGGVWSEWIRRALVFLVISCPCALVISIPLGFFGGIGAASKKGILVKGSNYLEALNSVDTVVMDKTGTLTKGNFKVTEINVYNSFSKNDLIEYAAYAENYSNHPIAASIKEIYTEEIDDGRISDYEEIAGHGISVLIDDKKVLVGNARLIENNNIEIPDIGSIIGTTIHLAINNIYAGHIIIMDEIKEDSKEAIKGLHSRGVKKVIMLTGDNKEIAEKVGNALGIDEVYAELLPDDKVNILESIMNKKASGGKTIFVGDGINDAPVIARADIGVAMGGLGSDAAIEASDITLMSDEPSKLVEAFDVAKFTRKIVTQNIVLALGVKAIVLVLGALGIASMWLAVFADVGVALIAILNATRLLKMKQFHC